MGQKYRALYTRSNYADIADSSKNYFVAYNNEEGIYGFISMTSQKCFIVFVIERKIRGSTIHTEHIVAFLWQQSAVFLLFLLNVKHVAHQYTQRIVAFPWL
jgi:hypothetical protein